jgi:hypothetical protein
LATDKKHFKNHLTKWTKNAKMEQNRTNVREFTGGAQNVRNNY